MEPEDWVIFVDAHEGLSIDTRTPQPNDVDVEPFRSYIYREISRANTAGKDRVVLPFYVFLRHDDLDHRRLPLRCLRRRRARATPRPQGRWARPTTCQTRA